MLENYVERVVSYFAGLGWGGLQIEIRRLTSKKQNVLICKESWGAIPVSASTSTVQLSSDLTQSS